MSPACDLYLGEMEAGEPHGVGKGFTDGDSYEGSWRKGVKHGKGEERTKEGIFYVGEFCSGVKEGMWKVLHCDGTSYEGGFKRGFYEGEGEYFLSDSNYYKGSFLGGKIEGN